MTADAMDGDRERFLATGMDDYLSKPVSSQALRAALARAERYSRSRASIPPQRSADSSPDPLAVLWPIFAEEASALIQAMEDALRQGDSGSLAQAAHSLKGSSGSFGFGRLHRLCAGIETEARASRLNTLPEWIRRIRSEFDHLLILRDTPHAASPSHKGTPGHQGDPA
jgi:HPt (histidine-containing phosphotransfer) domain-containing protein